MLCLLYVIASTAVLTLAGILIEYALPRGAPRRWLWCAIIGVSIVLPVYSITFHTAPAVIVWGRIVVPLAPSAAGRPADHSWLATLMSDSFYHRVLVPCLLVGVALFLIWGCLRALFIWRVIRVSRTPADDVDHPPSFEGLPVTVTDSLGPAAVGWRSRLLVPRWVFTLPAMQRRYLLRHEAEHGKANDQRVLALASIMVSLFTFNVLLWWQLWRLHLAIESDCDNRVVSALGDRDVYAELLITVAQAHRRSGMQPALLGRTGMLERRVVRLVSDSTPSLMRRSVAVTAAFLLLLTALSAPHPIRPHRTHGGGGRLDALLHALP